MASLVVKSAIRSQLKGMRASGDFFKSMDIAVGNMIKTAVSRAKGNNRKTCRGFDI